MFSPASGGTLRDPRSQFRAGTQWGVESHVDGSAPVGLAGTTESCQTLLRRVGASTATTATADRLDLSLAGLLRVVPLALNGLLVRLLVVLHAEREFAEDRFQLVLGLIVSGQLRLDFPPRGASNVREVLALKSLGLYGLLHHLFITSFPPMFGRLSLGGLYTRVSARW